MNASKSQELNAGFRWSYQKTELSPSHLLRSSIFDRRSFSFMRMSFRYKNVAEGLACFSTRISVLLLAIVESSRTIEPISTCWNHGTSSGSSRRNRSSESGASPLARAASTELSDPPRSLPRASPRSPTSGCPHRHGEPTYPKQFTYGRLLIGVWVSR